jgi:hypothetical protein
MQQPNWAEGSAQLQPNWAEGSAQWRHAWAACVGLLHSMCAQDQKNAVVSAARYSNTLLHTYKPRVETQNSIWQLSAKQKLDGALMQHPAQQKGSNWPDTFMSQ